jgi:DDE family transposase
LEKLFSQVFATNKVFKAMPFIRSVMVIDSTEVTLSKKLKEEYPGKRNRSSTAKLQALIDVVSTQILSFSIHKSNETDQGYRGHIKHVRSGDLLISDLGYFCIDTFKKIATQGGYFLSRLFKNAKIYDIETSKEINLRAKLSKTTETKLDIDIKLGKLKLSCRLVAIKLDEESYQKRLKNLKEKRRKDPRIRENINDVLNGWTIFITNLPISVTPQYALVLYSVRWQIELLFKAIKTFFNMRKIEQTNKSSVQILLYVSMIALTLLTLCILTIKNKEISLYKACKIFVKNINKFIEYLNDKTKCSILWMAGLLEEFALKETRTKRRSTKKMLGLTPLKSLS